MDGSTLYAFAGTDLGGYNFPAQLYAIDPVSAVATLILQFRGSYDYENELNPLDSFDPVNNLYFTVLYDSPVCCDNPELIVIDVISGKEVSGVHLPNGSIETWNSMFVNLKESSPLQTRASAGIMDSYDIFITSMNISEASVPNQYYSLEWTAELLRVDPFTGRLTTVDSHLFPGTDNREWSFITTFFTRGITEDGTAWHWLYHQSSGGQSAEIWLFGVDLKTGTWFDPVKLNPVSTEDFPAADYSFLVYI